MALLAKCPECGHQFRLPDKYAGMRGKCPECEHLFRAPPLEEEVADWGDEAEDVERADGGREPAVTAPTKSASPRPGRPKIPLPKRLAEVTPPPAPGADEPLPDLASLSVPGGPPPTPPPVAPQSEPEEALPDLSALTEVPASSPRPTSRKSAEPETETFPDFLVADGEGEGTEKKRRTTARARGGAVGDARSSRKRRSSDAFDADHLAAQLDESPTPSAEEPSPVETQSSPSPGDRPSQSPKPTRSAPPAATAATDRAEPKTTAQTSKSGNRPSAQPAAKSAAKPATKPTSSPSGSPLPKQSSAPATGKTRSAAGQSPDKKKSRRGSEATAKAKNATAERPATKRKAGSVSPAGLAVTADEGERTARPAAGRARQQPAKKPWLIIGICGSLAAVIVCFVGAWALTSWTNGNGAADGVDDGNSQSPEARVDRDAEGGPPTVAAAALGELSALKWDAVKHAVVRVQVITEDHRREVGTGFVIDPQGLVATAYSLIHHGTSATVVTYEKSYLVAGAVAVDPELDLAILKLEDVGEQANLPALDLDEDLQRLQRQTAYVFAEYFNSRLDSSQSIAERSLPMNELRPALRPFLPERARSNGLLNWIEVTGRVTGPAHGGPLVSADGEVIGVSMYLGESSRYSYALHVKHLVELRQAVGDEVTPLTPDPLARSDRPDRPDSVTDAPESEETPDTSDPPTESQPPEDDPADPDSAGDGNEGTGDEDPYVPPEEGPATPPDTDGGIATPPPDEPDLVEEPREITPAKLAEALQACEELNFVPITEEDYVKFQHLAFLLTEVQRIADSETQPQAKRDEFAKAAKEVTDSLASISWVDVDSVNELAVEALDGPHRGTFFYGTVGPTQSKDRTDFGRDLALLSIDGTEERVILPFDKIELSDLPTGGRWLVLGVCDPRRKMHYTHGDERRTVRIIEVKFIIAESRPE